MHSKRFQFFDQNPVRPDIVAEVKQGLRQTPKRLAPKFFYDARGSQLFEQITQLPEYYLTRTEVGILNAYKDELSGFIGKRCCLIEYGSGSSEKVRLLIDALEPEYYVPVDISKDHLHTSAKAIHDDFEFLHVYPTCADYTDKVQLPEVIDGAPRCGFFPGSSIGNFERDEALDFLLNLHRDIGRGGYCVIGFDTRKSKAILEPAYNDRTGVTATFNLNLLTHLNRTVQSDFDPSKFSHHAFYDATLGRIEMHLVSETAQQIHVDGEVFNLAESESIHTENSYKYSIEEVQTLAVNAGLTYVRHWQDNNAWFYVVLLHVSD